MIKALNNHAFVELIKGEVTSATGILIEAPTKLFKARILDVDVYDTWYEGDIKAGLYVYFTKEDFIPYDDKKGFVVIQKIIGAETYE